MVAAETAKMRMEMFAAQGLSSFSPSLARTKPTELIWFGKMKRIVLLQIENMAVILVVDDEIGIRELLSEILSDEGYGVLLAENASAARSAMTQHPDLVLLDIWMPDNDGVSS